jgi:hypothetical protein
MKKDLSGIQLMTHSKKEDYKNIISDSVYEIGGFLIKTFFLMDEMIDNKNDLQKIINDEKSLIEFRSQANLLDVIAFDKLDIIKVRFDSINLQLMSFSDILYKYFKNYIH